MWQSQRAGPFLWKHPQSPVGAGSSENPAVRHWLPGTSAGGHGASPGPTAALGDSGEASRSEEVTEKWVGASGGQQEGLDAAAQGRQESTPSGGAEGFPHCCENRTIPTKEKE